ncbi:anthranilate phosphoribosyltransferase [Blattabacterium sp. (Blaberus giganteus)]|uniref:anthranilate phosphoribosyltransferase n=1 Tax=Blattabacterium sp. (Blaberus giganteus) TaxID=1186051 RepID=UPI00025F6ED7|nr:anthranilate phosphoribosyltransferase [Blattabacterium sp. (Blaberus giganteus)]AFJ90664.1 anthranilate phosphoribosyltransferase [Blattabacterium sp. (Blaberus giganteus)]
MNKILEKLFLEKKLTKQEAKNLFIELSEGNINKTQAIAITTIYNMRYPTLEEIAGFRQAMMELSIKINLTEFNAIDIVGTGGDGKNTFNISTLACFIVAGAGEKVIKHGSYSSSSTTGSSNILKGLGYHFTNKEESLKNQLDKAGICYLHAPIFHPILKSISLTRRELGVRTIFNTLGPLLNPGNPKNQLLGVNNLELARIYYYMYQNTNNNYVIVHSLDGYDEITLTSDVKCYSPKGERFYSVEELEIGKKKVKVNPKELKGGKNTEENIRIFVSVLSGEGTVAQNEVVLTNATFALSLLNQDSLETNYDKAKRSLKSGKAKNILKKLLSL